MCRQHEQGSCKTLNHAAAIGEIVAASTTGFAAQCPAERLHTPPDFGSFVRVLPPGTNNPNPGTDAGSVVGVELDPFADPIIMLPAMLPADSPSGTLYALVYSASTNSAEPGRRPAAYGLDEYQLRAEQPQIFDLLATEFIAIHIGFADQGVLRSGTSPRPARLHAMVYSCTEQEIIALTEMPDFVRLMLNASSVGDADMLCAACLRTAYMARNLDFRFLVRTGKQLARFLRDEPERLTALLRRLEP